MKICVIFGGAASDNIKSFYVKDGTMYDFKNNKPHIFQAAYSPQFTTQIWNYCFFDEDGCFLNLAEWEDKLPDFDFFQYWRNTNDNDVERFLKLFTTLNLEEINRLANLKNQESYC